MGPVELAIRSHFTSTPVTLRTIGKAKPFVLSRIDARGIELLLGRKETQTPLTWACLESVVPFLQGQPGWVPAGGARSKGEPGTLDEPPKQYRKRDVARWLVVVLRDAGVVRVRDDALGVRLVDHFVR